MKSIYFSLPFHQDCQSATVIRVKSNWLALCAGSVGWVIMLIFSLGMTVLFHRYVRFPEDFREIGIRTLPFIASYLFILGSGLYFIYKRYFPSQWMTEAAINLEDNTITINSRQGTTVLPFSRISKVIFQGASPIFITNYLFWVEVENDRIPMVSFSSDPASNDFYFMLERRARLKMVQEPGN